MLKLPDYGLAFVSIQAPVHTVNAPHRSVTTVSQYFYLSKTAKGSPPESRMDGISWTLV